MKLSACMIVRNEEELLPACLTSIRSLCDEIIVVDTGSKDNTINIAKSFDVVLYEHKWEDDFSLHRNQSIQYATGDWILIIDADEELAALKISNDMFKLRLFKLPDNIKGLVVTVNEIDEKYNKLLTWMGGRFFRRDSGVYYYNAVHNQPSFVGDAAGTDIVLYHKGYSLPKEKMAMKHDRTVLMLLKRLGINPNDFNALYYIAHEYIALFKYREALECGTRCLSLLGDRQPEKMSYYGGLYYGMANCCIRLNDAPSAYSWIDKGLELFPDDIDLNFAYARLGYMTKRDDFVKHGATKYLMLYADSHPFLKESDANKYITSVEFKRCSYRAIHCRTPKAKKLVEFWLESTLSKQEDRSVNHDNRVNI